MPDFAELLQQGGAHAWLYFPSAILLGALHGLEPGHSKTMMAAFIVAIRGSVKQAVLLGLAATLSHTAVVWLVRQLSELGGLDLTEDAFLINSIIVWTFVGLYACAWTMISFLRVPEDEEKEKYGSLFGKKEVSER